MGKKLLLMALLPVLFLTVSLADEPKDELNLVGTKSALFKGGSVDGNLNDGPVDKLDQEKLKKQQIIEEALKDETKVVTNIDNVPLQFEANDARVLWLIPNETVLKKLAEDDQWYKVEYGEITGWVSKLNTVGGESKVATTTGSLYNSLSSIEEQNNLLTKEEKMRRIMAAADKYGKECNLDPLLILALIRIESNFDPNACSVANCRGLTQIHYKYAPDWGLDRERLYEIEYNIENGTKRIMRILPAWGGNIYDALREYNQGGSGARKSPLNGKQYATAILGYYRDYKANGFHY